MPVRSDSMTRSGSPPRPACGSPPACPEDNAQCVAGAGSPSVISPVARFLPPVGRARVGQKRQHALAFEPAIHGLAGIVPGLPGLRLPQATFLQLRDHQHLAHEAPHDLGRHGIGRQGTLYDEA